ncbi:hypothetical protein ACLB1G_09650 [Oxalobacteraceae bacterium A2-2]
MLSYFPVWLLALPVLLLPVWWHRQKRQRIKAEPLATARFLPSAPPEQLRVWQWRDRILLLVRCLLLIALVAWLALVVFPWRGDTVLLDSGLEPAWAEKQIAAAGMGGARRITLDEIGALDRAAATGRAAGTPAGAARSLRVADDSAPVPVLSWLRRNERDWNPSARLMVVARADRIAMPARVPQFAHLVELRLQPAAPSAAAAAASKPHHVAIAAPEARLPAWRALFAAFAVAGAGAERYELTEAPDAATELIIWDQPGSPPADWRAPLWWLGAASVSALPELAKPATLVTLVINGITLQYADSPRGRLWSANWPLHDADGARAIFESWQALTRAAQPYPAPSQTLAAARSVVPPMDAPEPAPWLAYALAVLFMLERILTHARRT